MYVKEEELTKEMFLSKKSNELSYEGMKLLSRMIESQSHRYKFTDETQRKDVIVSSMLFCYRYWRNFDPDKGRAFVFFSNLIKDSFRKFEPILKGV